MKKAIVLGAGITGLYIADQLAKSGYNVTVIEKTKKVGGMASSFNYKDFTLDYGPHKFYTYLPGIYEEFMKIVGEGNYLIVKKKNSIRLLGKYFNFPVKLSELLLNINPIISFKIGLDFFRSFFKKMKIKSYEDYFVKGFGRTGYSIIFKGFAEKVWGINPKNLSEELARRRSPASNIFDVLKTILIKNKKDVSAEYFYYPKHGYGVICDNLANSIIKNKGKILLETFPTKINVKNNKVVSVEVSKSKKKKISCDVLVSSLSINEMPLLLNPNIPNDVAESFKELKFRSLIICYVFLKKEKALKDNWLFFPEKEFCFNRVAEQKSFSSFTAPAEKTVLTAEITCNYNDNIYNAHEEKLKELVLKDLEKAGLIKKEEVYDFFIRKAGRVYPVYSMEYKKNLNKVLGYLDNIGNIYTVGRLGLFNYNNADHCIDMAMVTSDIIIKGKSLEEWRKARNYFDSYKIVD